MKTKDELSVNFRDSLVGTIVSDHLGKMSFQYSRTWLDSQKNFPISISLPLDTKIYGDVAHFWFANLLPEQQLRTSVARRLRISESNDFALLKALGGECAGALTINEGAPIDKHKNTAKLVSNAEILNWIEHPHELPLIDNEKNMRLSLAGAQDKIPVFVRDDQIFLPHGGAASTHILKLPSRDFKQLTENEYFTTRLAKAFGLNVHQVLLKKIDRKYVTLSQRYDRFISENGEVSRLHQEDFCQAMGLPSYKKYEADGGPNLARCINLACEHTSHPVKTLEQLIKWTIFNFILGNCDAHAKNLSFIWNQNGEQLLSPFYDLVSTLVYKSLSRKLALHIGEEADIYKISQKNFKIFAENIGVKFGIVKDELLKACDSLPELVTSEAAAMKEIGATFSKEREVIQIVLKQTQRIKKMLRSKIQ